MAQVETIIRYDGPALADHEMDVEELAPALLALASLIQLANHKFNGSRSAVRVVVNADIEQKCFQIQIKLIQDILQHAKSFLDGDMATIKEICEWIGIVGTSSLTLFKLLVKLAEKKQDTTVFNADASNDATIFQIQNLHLHLPPGQVKQLLADEAIVGKAQEVLKPATKPGYETVGFHRADGTSVFSANKLEADAVLALPSELGASEGNEETDLADEDHNEIHARVMVKTQRNEGKAQWELKWAARAEWASIDDSEWLGQFQTGQVPHTIPFYLDVQLDMVTSRSNPDAPARFHVLKVNGVVPTQNGTQGALFDGEASDELR